MDSILDFSGLDFSAFGGSGFGITPEMLDAGVFVLVALGVVQGFFRGGIRQISGFVGLVLGIKIGLEQMHQAGSWAAGHVDFASALEPYVGFVLLFFLVRMAVYLIGFTVLWVVGLFGLQIVDKMAGSALGAMKTALTISLFFVVFGYLGIPDASVRSESRFYATIHGTLPRAYSVVRTIIPDLGRLEDLPQDIVAMMKEQFTGGVVGSSPILDRAEEFGESIQTGRVGEGIKRLSEEGKRVSSEVLGRGGNPREGGVEKLEQKIRGWSRQTFGQGGSYTEAQYKQPDTRREAREVPADNRYQPQPRQQPQQQPERQPERPPKQGGETMDRANRRGERERPVDVPYPAYPPYAKPLPDPPPEH